MTFDPTLPECLHRFRTSTWCLQRGHIAVFAPRPQVLQGLQVSIGNGTPPRGVVWLHGPGLALDSLITLIAAPAASDLLEERRRLVAYCGGVASLVPLRSQMPVVTALLHDRVVLPARGGEAEVA